MCSVFISDKDRRQTLWIKEVRHQISINIFDVSKCFVCRQHPLTHACFVLGYTSLLNNVWRAREWVKMVKKAALVDEKGAGAMESVGLANERKSGRMTGWISKILHITMASASIQSSCSAKGTLWKESISIVWSREGEGWGKEGGCWCGLVGWQVGTATMKQSTLIHIDALLWDCELRWLMYNGIAHQPLSTITRASIKRSNLPAQLPSLLANAIYTVL